MVGRVLSTALFVGYVLSGLTLPLVALPKSASRRARQMYSWLVFDLGIHTIHESVFLYQNIVAHRPVSASGTSGSPSARVRPWLPSGVHVWADPTRAYGAYTSDSPWAAIWTDYGRADRRWAGPDLQVVTVEVIMCLFGTVLTVLALWLIHADGGKITARAAFPVMVMSVMELLGYWSLFAPELMTGAPNFDLTKMEHIVVHLGIMNAIWLFFPLWCLVCCYRVFTRPSDEDAECDIGMGALPPSRAVKMG